MRVDPHDVVDIAALARLAFDEVELHRLAGELSTILSHMDVLRELELDAVEPYADDDADGPLRPDMPGADVLHIGPDALAPAWQDGFYTVPRLPVLGGDAAAAPDTAP